MASAESQPSEQRAQTRTEMAADTQSSVHKHVAGRHVRFGKVSAVQMHTCSHTCECLQPLRTVQTPSSATQGDKYDVRQN